MPQEESRTREGSLRCLEDNGLAEDVLQEHKTWEKCQNYIIGQARKMAAGKSSIGVKDETVYEWAEDYFHKDDKAEEEKKMRQQKEQTDNSKKDLEKPASKKEPKKVAKKKNTPAKAEAKATKIEKSKDGQLCLFDL